MNKISVIILTKAHEAITDILELQPAPAPPKTKLPLAPAPPKTKLPPAPAPPKTKLPPAVLVDSEGLPWDKRIHSGGKTFLAKDGTWKLARGVASLLVAQVKTELRQAQEEPPRAQEHTPLGEITTNLTWAQLMEKIADAATGTEEVSAACRKFNVQNIGILQDTPVLVPLVAKELGF